MSRGIRYQATLRINHPTCDPDWITHSLNLGPEFTRRSGAPRVALNGEPLQGVWKKTQWIYPICNGAGDLEERLLAFSRSLLLSKLFFDELSDGGGDADFFVGWFPDGNSEMSLPPELLRIMGELGISLALDLYAPESPAFVPKNAG